MINNNILKKTLVYRFFTDKAVKDKIVYRLFEIMPGFLVWSSFIILLILSFIKPVWVIYFILIHSTLWLVRVFYFIFYVFVSWRKYKQEIQVDWMKKVKTVKGWDDIYHAVFLPTYKEPYEVIKYTFEGLKNCSYPKDKIIVVLGGEGRAEKEFTESAEKIKKEYSGVFKDLIITVHPPDVPGEIIGKGSNVHYMGVQFKKYVDEKLKIPYENIVVSSFDIDTVVHPQYFARLSYAYLTEENPLRASYQPLALYNNNIWESYSFTRVVANSTTFWLMTELSRPEQFMTFSSHSMPFKALVDVGFWQKDIVTEDSRIFLQCFLRYNGDYRLVPIYVPVSMDTVSVKSFWRTVKNQYKQLQRWAWSVEHQPYLFTNFIKNKKISLHTRLRYLWKLVEGQYTWATATIFLLVFTRLPFYITHIRGESYALVQNAPLMIDSLLTFAMSGLLVTAYFNVLLLTEKPPDKPLLRYLTVVLQWFLLPVTLVIFGAIPAIDAQTRLMLGKYLGFWNTEKTR